jgi:hypothetical protein
MQPPLMRAVSDISAYCRVSPPRRRRNDPQLSVGGRPLVRRTRSAHPSSLSWAMSFANAGTRHRNAGVSRPLRPMKETPAARMLSTTRVAEQHANGRRAGGKYAEFSRPFGPPGDPAVRLLPQLAEGERRAARARAAEVTVIRWPERGASVLALGHNGQRDDPASASSVYRSSGDSTVR